MICKATEDFNWDKAFLDKSAGRNTSILTKAILSVMSNFIPNEIVTIGDGDPPCINNKIKSLIKNKTEYFKNYVKPNNPVLIRHFEYRRFFKKILKLLSKSIIPNFLENLHLIKSIPNVTILY